MRRPIAAGRARRGVSPLLIVGVVALLVVGFMAVNSLRVLGEFFGGGGSDSGDETPPVPAAATTSSTEAPRAPAGGQNLAALQARVQTLEARLAAEVSGGDVGSAEATRETLRDARAARDAALRDARR